MAFPILADIFPGRVIGLKAQVEIQTGQASILQHGRQDIRRAMLRKTWL